MMAAKGERSPKKNPNGYGEEGGREREGGGERKREEGEFPPKKREDRNMGEILFFSDSFYKDRSLSLGGPLLFSALPPPPTLFLGRPVLLAFR
jgi:hypothetical protein